MMPLLPLALMLQPLPDAVAPPPPQTTCDLPVYMVVAGPTHDRARMLAYGKAIAESGLYERLGGYHINVPQPVATFEGEPPAGHVTLIVRFPASKTRAPSGTAASIRTTFTRCGWGRARGITW